MLQKILDSTRLPAPLTTVHVFDSLLCIFRLFIIHISEPAWEFRMVSIRNYFDALHLTVNWENLSYVVLVDIASQVTYMNLGWFRSRASWLSSARWPRPSDGRPRPFYWWLWSSSWWPRFLSWRSWFPWWSLSFWRSRSFSNSIFFQRSRSWSMKMKVHIQFIHIQCSHY